MWSRPESDEALVNRLLPSCNPDPFERARAWSEWQSVLGNASLRKFISFYNNTNEPDDEIYQDALLTAYIEVERGRYQRRDGIPFTAYVKGIARNKIREARRRERGLTSLDEASQLFSSSERQPEASVEWLERQRELYHGLARLPGVRKQVLEHYIHGKSTAEIAAEMSISEELVRQHKCRGLRTLQQQLNTYGSD